MNPNPVSFVIPMFDKFHLTFQLLLDIQQYSSSVDEVLVLDNGSVERDTELALEFQSQRSPYFPIRVARVENNVGFIHICNWGVPQAKCEAVVLISNDVRIQSDLANEVRQKLTDNNILGGVLYRDTTGWNEFDDTIFPYLEGWLLAFKKKTWKDVGGFDDDFAPFDYEDVDFSTSARNMGCDLVQLEGNYRHLAASTIGYNDERLEITKRNREIFKRKWVE